MAHKRPRSAFEADLQKQESPFVAYGTPLPPLDSEIRDDGSYLPVWKQEVTDERGRKRLHGAFTGGYSAGYFNTVGSKEGWTPSTFVSSRSNRHKDEQKQLRPEDYMDEEDLAEQAEAQKLQTNEDFAGFGATSEEAARRGNVMDLFKPQGETMGVKLLRRMGWRDGQGIGPKVRRPARFQEDGDAEASEHAYAPDDTPLVAVDKKEDRKGLGFVGEESMNGESRRNPAPHEEDDDAPSIIAPRKPARPTASSKPKQGGFGMGVLNGTGSDDEDPYEMGPRVSYNKVLGGDKKKAKAKAAPQRSSVPSANPLLGSKPIFKPQKFSSTPSTSFRKCNDGRLPLDGFLLADPLTSLSISEDADRYPIPTVPEGWTSSKLSTSQAAATTAYKSTADIAKASTLDPKSRAALLGETTLPGKSIFDYLSPAARDRLAAASGRQDLPAGRGEAPPITHNSNTTAAEADEPLPTLDKDTATAALSRGTGGWMPYTDDPAKRDRYRVFLEWNAGIRESPLDRPSGMKRETWVGEMREFAHAARVFRPVSGAMAQRFQSSSVQSTSQSSSNLQTPSTSQAQPPEGTHTQHPQIPKARHKGPAEEAAALGMFGPLTRQALTFYPSRLLCKRFGVKVPSHVDSGNEGRAAHCAEDADAHGHPVGDRTGRESETGDVEGEKQTAAKRLLGLGMRSFTKGPVEHAGPNESEGVKLKGDGLADVKKEPDEQEVDVEKNEALEAQRAGEELFRAVFGDEDD